MIRSMAGGVVIPYSSQAAIDAIENNFGKGIGEVGLLPSS